LLVLLFKRDTISTSVDRERGGRVSSKWTKFAMRGGGGVNKVRWMTPKSSTEVKESGKNKIG